MFCSKCGTEIAGDVKYCPNCGNSLVPNIQNIASETPIQYHESGRGSVILILGILGLIFGPFTGIPAWVMGAGDLKKIKTGIISLGERSSTKVGMVLGIITTMIVPFVIIMGIATVIGVNLYSTNAVTANRDGVIADLNNHGAMAQQYYRKPFSLGGGGNTFNGWAIPASISTTPNGTYVESVYPQHVIIVGTGNEQNQGNPIQHTATITPTTITIVKNN
jgi:Tfp pilus assembly protein PilE